MEMATASDNVLTAHATALLADPAAPRHVNAEADEMDGWKRDMGADDLGDQATAPKSGGNLEYFSQPENIRPKYPRILTVPCNYFTCYIFT